jgi:NAD(P)-dependent dehydrogenase (short-subunit alcohol dehydrogenase family)
MAFVEAGYDVAIVARDRARGERVQAELNGRGLGRCVFLPLDVADEGSLEKAIDATVSELGGLDVLVNNAASFLPTRTIDETPPDVLREMLEVNVVGYFRACRAALPHLRKRKHGASTRSTSSAWSSASNWRTGCCLRCAGRRRTSPIR